MVVNACAWLWMRMALLSVEVATWIVLVLSEHLIPLVAIVLLRFHHTVLPKCFAEQIFHPPQIPLHCRNIQWNNCPCGNDHHRPYCMGKERTLKFWNIVFWKQCTVQLRFITWKFSPISPPIFTSEIYPIYFLCIYIQDVALVNILYWSGFDKDTTAVIHMSLGVCQRTAKCVVNSSPLRYSSLF